eukprot:gnl/MRDRNA2_/MRDRNA2_95091_c0_seq1.p1 gnl/MRDRNA2_/MRDRNA2_95091_c0~~gnl/MRDRNA2_/MRDRNA2_95091_c0_seq1.p1  ORF type:complete len:345 (+),score=96.08 gnl/MRDRNA2_/MRDRNA2_95091_c0_seq1:97-1035(+)
MWDSIFGTDEPEPAEENKENSPEPSEQSNTSLVPAQKSNTDWKLVLDGKERSPYGPWAKDSLREKMYRKHVLGEEIDEPSPALQDMPRPAASPSAKGTGKGSASEKPKARPKKKKKKAAADGEEKEEKGPPKTKYERCLQEGMDHIDRVKRLYEDIKALKTKPDKWIRFRAARMWQDLDDILEDYHKTIQNHQQLIDIYEHIGEACDNVELELQRAEILPWFAGSREQLEFDLLKEEKEGEPDFEYPDWVRDLDWEWFGVDKDGNPAPEGMYKGPSPGPLRRKASERKKEMEKDDSSDDDGTAKPFKGQFEL